MITLIISVILVILGIILFIIALLIDSEKALATGLCLILIPTFITITCLVFGKSIYKQDVDLKEKEQIEYLLENRLDLYSIEQAEDYNKEIEFGNNYWCRFNIEDRSEYKIDIDKYLKKED